ncbi:heme-binding domain-containing protein [Aquimarina sp. ERC-38]|uniref:heme-binding domain-containing protein n=1 Tax=Aquimarina sp. ERC-38 TaxID=2949996 RepID=UPI002246179D|nr:heme-binding domain-containing protein [Aquimarina sp. ERC-38]UZO80432.1 heme-binding domain-containing protein [Aquimarina sp. ERC-38]
MKKKIFILIVVLIVVLQFFNPAKNDAGYQSVELFEKETNITPGVQQIFKTDCYDCHSNHSVYPWYASIAPFSFFIDHHIEEGKEHFNVSDWATYSDKKKDHKLEELIEEVEEGEMPLLSYTWLHGDLTEAEKKDLINWATELRKKY